MNPRMASPVTVVPGTLQALLDVSRCQRSRPAKADA